MDDVEKQRHAVHELQRWLKGQSDAAALPPGLAATPPEDLKRVCKGEMVSALTFLLPHLPAPAAAQHMRLNLQVAGSASTALSESLRTRVAELEARKAKLQEELQAARHRQAVAMAACSVVGKKIQAAEESHEAGCIKHQETWQRTALFGALTHDCTALSSSLQHLKGRLRALLLAVVDESSSGAVRTTATTLGLMARSSAPQPARGSRLNGAALVRQLEGRCAQCCFTLQQDLRRLKNNPGDETLKKDGDGTASALAKLRREHVAMFIKTEELRNATQKVQERNKVVRAQLEHRLASQAPETAEQHRRWLQEQQRQALRRAALAFVKDEILRLLELQSELMMKRRQEQGHRQQLEELEAQRQQRFQELRRAVSHTQARHRMVQCRIAGVAQRLRGLPTAVVREALGASTGFTLEDVTREADAAMQMPLAMAVYSAPGTPPVLALGCAEPLANLVQMVGIGSFHSADAVLRRCLQLVKEHSIMQRRADEWQALGGSLQHFLGEAQGWVLALQDKHRFSEAAFRLQCLPQLQAALPREAMRTKLQEAQAVVEDWVFEPAAYTLPLTIQDLTVEEWMQRYRRLQGHGTVRR
eukprot:GGOE01041511.1.p1 GENE.GGOE01041511.1~~GGOE01041511.1.p1  ORF type:complete len:589 (-),score=161.99 GGOE01041511.1:180-1946(-)